MTKPIPMLDLKSVISPYRHEILEAINNVVDSCAFINGPIVNEFEGQLAHFLGQKYTVGLNSGTDALTIALKSLQLPKGSEVITTPFTFFATVEAILHAELIPVFVDIRQSTFNINESLIEEAITSKTKVILPVHMFGFPCEMGKIGAIATKHNLEIIEDCAQAFGSTFNGRFLGTFGKAGCYSFFPSKNLGAFGDGGMLTTNNKDIADKAAMLRSHGSKKKYFNEMLGYNSRLDSIQAAILSVRLKYIHQENEARNKAAEFYNERLADCPDITTPTTPSNASHSFHQYSIIVPEKLRDQLQAFLSERGIASFVYYPIPMHQLPINFKFHSSDLAVTESVAKSVLSLPIWPGITTDTQLRICKSIANFFKKN